MKHYLIILLLVLVGLTTYGQVSSNKGTEFWVGFMDHIDGTSASLDLYITSDSNTTGTVSIPGGTWSTTFTVTANQMTLVSVPSADAHVDCGDCTRDKGIKVTSQKPVVVYSHIYNNFRSDATLVLPVASTGQNYFVMSYSQKTNGQHSQFMVISAQDNTKVRITPTDDVGSRPANTSYEIVLDEGEAYQGQAPGLNDDLTGTKIEVIDTGSNASCKKVSVFCGSSFTSLGCTGFASGDNLYQQIYPVSAWSREFVTVPFKGRNYDRFRVLASQDNTVLIINGNYITTLNEGQFYETGSVSITQHIFGSKPISVAQFQVSQRCGGLGDPSMTILSPIDQTLKDITLYSSAYEDIDDNYINVIMPTSDTNTFTIDGNKVAFTTVSSLPTYSYARLDVSAGNQRLKADEGFLAIAYGFGNVESYGYSAGANVTNLNQFITLDDNKTRNINTICLGETAKFKGNANFTVAKWEWFFGDDSTSSIQNPTHVYKDTGSYTVKMYTTKPSFDGCSLKDSAISVFKVVNYPEVNAVFDNACFGDTIVFKDSIVSNHPYGTELVLWNFGDENRVIGRNPAHIYDTAGVYHLEFTVRNKFECTTVFKDSVEVYPLPSVDFSIENTCFKDSVKMADSSIAMPYPINTWIWNMGDGYVDTLSVPNYFYLYDTFGTFDVTLTTVTEKGCEQSKDTTFTKYQPFVPLFAAEDVCLKADLFALDTSILLSDGIEERNWFINDAQEGTMVSFSKKMDSAKDYSVKLVLKQNDFCSDSFIKTVTVHPQLDLDFTLKNTCFRDSTELQASSSPSAQTFDSFFWNLNGNIYVGSEQKVVFQDTGSNLAWLYSQTSNGCLDTLRREVNIQPKPVASFMTNIFCAEDSAIIWNTSEDFGSGFSVIDWASNGRFSMGNPDSFNFILGDVKKETIKLVVFSSDGCKDTAEQEIIVYPRPQVSFVAENHCLGEQIVLKNNTVNDSGTIISWNWNMGNNMTFTDSLPNYIYPQDGVYKVKLSAVSSYGCMGADSSNVEVYEPPVANVQIKNACLGEDVLVNDLSMSNSGSIANTTFVLADGSRIGGPSASISFTSVGPQSIRAVASSTFGCIDSSLFSALVHPLPKANFGALNDKGCEPFIAEFLDSSTVSSGNIVDWKWEANGFVFSTINNPINQFNQPGFKNIKLVVQSDSGCMDSLTKPTFIEVFSSPIANFAYNPLEPTIIDNEVSFKDSSLGNVRFWDWEFGDGNSSIEEDPINTFTDTGLYRVSLLVTDDNDCEGDTFRNIYIKPAFFVFVPNAFTPNRDGLNETWGPEGVLQGVAGYELQIFNRWGEILFESKDPNEKWDGTYQGEPVQEGYYAFRMRYTDFGRTKWITNNGDLLLLR